MGAGMAAGEGEGHEEVLSESDFALSKLNRALELLAVASEPHPSPARLRLLVKMEVGSSPRAGMRVWGVGCPSRQREE